MISSRRLAREWALRILYQIDIGKTPAKEAVDSALESLRSEFSQRGARTASGSRLESLCLQTLTSTFTGNLTTLSPALERTLILGASQVVLEAPYWLELCLEKALKRQIHHTTFDPPMILSSLDNRLILPQDPRAQDAISPSYFALSDEERRVYRSYIVACRQNLPEAFSTEFKEMSLIAARQIAKERPAPYMGVSLQDYLREARETFLEKEQERWRKMSPIIQKQMSDWVKTAAFTQRLVEGTLAQKKTLDTEIQKVASGWALERLVSVDRNILRLGCYEILYVPAIAPGVSINEAVELAKKYSTADSGSFVNGVLGAITTQAKLHEGKALSLIDNDNDVVLDLPEDFAITEEEE